MKIGVELGDRVYKSLDDIFNDKQHCQGLLDGVKPKKHRAIAPPSTVQKFENINRFYAQHGAAPRIDSADLTESLLAASLFAIKKDHTMVEQLKPLDWYKLL